jgi:hypothetical protein
MVQERIHSDRLAMYPTLEASSMPPTISSKFKQKAEGIGYLLLLTPGLLAQMMFLRDDVPSQYEVAKIQPCQLVVPPLSELNFMFR